jgi:glucose/arabinose dehydrogenase
MQRPLPRIFLTSIFCLSLCSLSLLLHANPSGYKPLAQSCGGLPQLPLGTPDGTCVGLLAQRAHGLPLKRPRSLVDIGQQQLLVLDSGGWEPQQGRLLLLDYRRQPVSARVLLDKLNLPHKILFGPKGALYFSEAQQISRVFWRDGALSTPEVVLKDLPFNKEYLHPLKNFAFDGQGNMLVNIGSRSDRCENTAPSCLDGSEASVRLYTYLPEQDRFNPAFTLLGRGLRNSMALAAHPSGTLLQAENSVDLRDADDPYEEVNVLQPGKFYGWPQCYNAYTRALGGLCTAADYQAPWTLLPPHVAPLDMLYYQGEAMPQLKNTLVMSWHGYRATGHRLVAFNLDDKGRPLLQPSARFNRSPTAPGQPVSSHEFAPREPAQAKSSGVSQARELIFGWHAQGDGQPKGAPVGISQAPDGSLWLLDDKNAAILKFTQGQAYSPKALSPASPSTAPSAPGPGSKALPEAIARLLKQHCSQCHTEISSRQSLLDAGWINTQDGRSLLETKIFFDTARPMPPGQTLTQEEKAQLRAWLETGSL